MGKKIHDLLRFSEFLSEFRKVKRQIYANGEDRFENDVEHSYMLAMSAWYVLQKEGLKLDLSKVLKYALVHDIVEVYAGDTYFYAADKKDKEKRERAAADRIKKEFAEFPELHAFIHEYESRKDAESRFVYALDKLQPIIQIYLDGGRTYREKGITLDMIKENKIDKVSVDPTVKALFDEFMDILKRNKKKLWRS